MEYKTFTTTSLTWDDGDWQEEAASAKDAAINHAIEGWENEEVPDEDRGSVIIQVTDHDGDVTQWKIEWVRPDRLVPRQNWKAKAERID